MSFKHPIGHISLYPRDATTSITGAATNTSNVTAKSSTDATTKCTIDTTSTTDATTGTVDATTGTIDAITITESWLSSDDSIKRVVTKECLEYDYKLFLAPCLHRRGGGVALLIEDGINVTQQDHHLQRSFEYIELLITTVSIHVCVVVIYRHLISKVNKFTKSQFIHVFSEFLEGLSTSSGRLLICGDFNINWPNETDNNRKKSG